MIVTEARYRVITLDTTSETVVVSGALVDAQGMVEDELRRPLDRVVDTTERLTIYRCPDHRLRAMPRRYPVVAVPAGATYQVENGASLIDVATDDPWLSNHTPNTASLTFTAGWLPADDPTAATYPDQVVPHRIEMAVAQIARGMICQNAVAVASMGPISQAQVGDVQVVFAAPTVGWGIEGYAPGITAEIAGYRYRPWGL